jgi:hypothetical protein
VEKPDLYDPKLNQAYAELAAHYGVLVDPARARKPKDKPRVERQMPYIRDSWWKGREFTSLVEMQASALHWCREVAGQRKHRGLDGRTPIQVFDQAEAGTLTPLPVAVFTLAEWSRAKVAPDVHIKCGKALYSAPWKLIGQLVDIRATATMVQVFHHGELVKTHVRKDKGRATDVADYPPEKIAFHTRTLQWCRDRAEHFPNPSPSRTRTCAPTLPAAAQQAGRRAPTGSPRLRRWRTGQSRTSPCSLPPHAKTDNAPKLQDHTDRVSVDRHHFRSPRLAGRVNNMSRPQVNYVSAHTQ